MAKFEKEGRVSIWLGMNRCDESVELLPDLCGVQDYNLDDQEVNLDDQKWKLQSVEKLLEPISYSNSFIEEAVQAATKRGLDKALYVLCQFDFVYDPKRVKSKIEKDPIFLGHFAWDDSED